MDKCMKCIPAFLLVVALLTFVIVCVNKANNRQEIFNWNEGVCKKCHAGKLEFTSVYNLSGVLVYQYSCGRCGNTERFQKKK